MTENAIKYGIIVSEKGAKKRGGDYRTSVREFSVRLSFKNQAWRDATPFLLLFFSRSQGFQQLRQSCK